MEKEIKEKKCKHNFVFSQWESFAKTEWESFAKTGETSPNYRAVVVCKNCGEIRIKSPK